MENIVKIARIEEQMKAIEDKIDTLDGNIEKEFKELKKEMTCFVRREEFAPYKRALDVVLGIVITAVVGGVLALILV